MAQFATTFAKRQSSNPFARNSSKETDSACVLHYDMQTRTGDGLMADLSGNGNNGTITAAVSSEGVFGKSMDFSNVVSLITKSDTTSLSLTTDMSFSFWIRRKTAAGNQRIIEKGTNGYQIYMSTATLLFGKDGIGTIASGSIGTEDIWKHIVVTYNNTTAKIYLDTVSIDGATTQRSIEDTATALVVGGNGVTSCGGFLDDVRIYNEVISDAKIAELYSEGAKKLNFHQSMTDVPPTLANLTVAQDRIGKTDFKVSTGQWKVSEDSNGKKWIECVSTGTAYMESTQAYGTWLWDMNKQGEGSTTTFLMMADVIGGTEATGQDGYSLQMNSEERTLMRKSVNGTHSANSYTAASYINVLTDYKFAVTRRYDGQFSHYIKGGIYTDWTLTDVSGGGGTNPWSDNNVKTSKYICLTANNVDKYSNIIMLEGVLTLAQLNQMY